MNNSEYFKSAFDEVHLSNAVYDNLMMLDVNKSRFELARAEKLKKQRIIRYATCAAAAFALCIVGVGAIVHFSNSDASGNKDTSTKLVIDTSIVDVEEDLIRDLSAGGEAQEEISGSVVTEGTKIYLIIEQCDIKIDITDNVDDGHCKGGFEFDNAEYEYEIFAMDSDYSVIVHKK